MLEQPSIVIMGGGIAGVETALQFADEGYKVTLIEQLGELLSGTSDNSAHRLGHGIHYIGDEASVNKTLLSTIEFTKKYKDFLLDNPNEKGRYLFVVPKKPDEMTYEQFLEGLKKLKLEYIRLIEKDPTNKVLGEPEDLYRILSEEEYKGLVHPDIKIAGGISSKEKILNWPKYKAHLLERIKNSPNIKVKLNTKINSAQEVHTNHYKINATNLKTGKEEKIDADFVVNATWLNIEAINENTGLKSPLVDNRLKVFLDLELPESLKNQGSVMLLKGSYAMFVDRMNGKATLTYAPVTNYSNKVDQSLTDQEILKWAEGTIPEQKEKEIIDKLLKGAASTFPELKDAKVLRLGRGVVKTPITSKDEKIDINDPNSAHHKRNQDGVVANEFNWISNAAMKFFDCVLNAKNVLRLFKDYEKTRANETSMLWQTYVKLNRLFAYEKVQTTVK